LKSIENNSQKWKTPSQKIIQPLRRFDIASIGDISLPWPRFNIKSTLYNGIVYTITNTCAVDSVLFVYYFILKTASTSIKNLFSHGMDPKYYILNKTMELVDSDGWDIARLYWLTANNRLSVNTNTSCDTPSAADTITSCDTSSKYHDIFGTVNKNVYKYLRSMQNHVFSTECTTADCRKRRKKRGDEIILR
jgi:hypothetical protein